MVDDMTNKTKIIKMLEKLKILIYIVFAYLGIEVETFMILVVFMCIDSALGAIKSMRLGDSFSFRKMLWGFILKLCFLVVPLVIALLGKALGYNFNSVVSVTISILTVAEAYSIIGNIYSAKNKKVVDRMDVVSIMLINLRKLLKKTLQGMLGKIEDFKKD
jgi:phage-related holin